MSHMQPDTSHFYGNLTLSRFWYRVVTSNLSCMFTLTVSSCVLGCYSVARRLAVGKTAAAECVADN